MKNLILLLFLIASVLILSKPVSGQISINLDGSAADPSAALDVNMAGKGLLPPRMALSALNLATPVTSPATGLVVYNTATAGTAPNNVEPGYYFWNGSGWASLPPPRGSATGEMLFWNGTGWDHLSPGLEGQKLQLQQNGIPVWSGPSVPALTTDTVVNILQTTATVEGTVTSNGGSLVQFKGICWGTSPYPDISGQHSTEYFGESTITGFLSGLEPTTRYFVRAYATNSVGTGYGNQLSFVTEEEASSVYTCPASHVTSVTTKVGGNVMTDRGTPCPGLPSITYDGKTYHTVQIGTQCWLKENLNIGTRVNWSQSQTDNSTIEKYCYDNLESNCDVYGGLYQWAEVVQYLNGATNSSSWNPAPSGNIQGICPSGWHVPKGEEYDTLINYLGGPYVAGGSSFYADLHLNCQLWTATENTGSNALINKTSCYDEYASTSPGPKTVGYSVRCIKNQ